MTQMEKLKNPQKKKENDPLQSLKFKGYCWSQSVPGDTFTLNDLVTFAKFFLCKMSNRLWKDPIWDHYTDEEILIEYFAHLYSKDETARKEFEVQLGAGEQIYGDDIYEWLDKKVKENQEEMNKKLKELPDKVSFSPENKE